MAILSTCSECNDLYEALDANNYTYTRLGNGVLRAVGDSFGCSIASADGDSIHDFEYYINDCLFYKSYLNR